MEGITIATLLASAGDVFSEGITWVGEVATTIAGNPLLLLGCVGIPLCGLGIGFFKRLMSTHV